MVTGSRDGMLNWWAEPLGLACKSDSVIIRRERHLMVSSYGASGKADQDKLTRTAAVAILAVVQPFFV